MFDEGQEQEIESLADFLDDLTDSPRVDLQIAKIIEKDEVVTRGIEIADDIARMFEMLMPLYEALCHRVLSCLMILCSRG